MFLSAVVLGVSSYIRQLAGTPPVVLNNMFLEADKTNLVDGHVLLQRPGLVEWANVGKQPVKGIFTQTGTFTGDFFVATGSSLVRVDARTTVQKYIGSIFAPSRVQFAASKDRLLIATGNICYSTDGKTLKRVTMPDDVPVSSVAYINGYFILTQQGAQRFYWIAPGETNPDALSFASAENNPDDIARVEHLGDALYFFGSGHSTEVWVPTGDGNLPFKRVEGILYDQGCANRDTVAKLDNTIFWVGSDSIVYRMEDRPVRISDNSIEEIVSETAFSDMRAWTFSMQGHIFYCLTLGRAGTRVYDVASGQWGQFSSYGRESWAAHMGAQVKGGLIIAGDDISGQLWRLDPTVSNDAGKPMIRECIGGVAVLGPPVPCASFSAYVATGHANANAPGDNPIMQLRFSDDGGNIWSNWLAMPLGKRGQYGRMIAKTRLGMMRAPGRMFHLRMTEDSVCRVSFARVNEYVAA